MMAAAAGNDVAVRPSRWCGVALAMAWLAWPASAVAQPTVAQPTVTQPTLAQPMDTDARQPGLRWDAPVGCPDAASVAQEIELLVGASEDGSHGAAIDGRVVVGAGGYVLRLSIAKDGQVESRTVTSEDCRLLSRAAALLVAITVDAMTTAETLTQRSERVAAANRSPATDPGLGLDTAVQPPPPIPEAGSVQPPPERPDPSETDESPGPSWRHGIEGGVGGGLGIALVPGITGGLEADIGWRYGPVRLRAMGFHWFGRARRVEGDSGVFAALSGAGIRGCYALSAGRLELPLCVGPDVGALHGRGIGASVEASSPVDLWVAIAVGVGAEVPVSPRFALRGRVELVATIRRPALHLDGPQGQLEVFRAPPFGFRIVLGASVRSK